MAISRPAAILVKLGIIVALSLAVGLKMFWDWCEPTIHSIPFERSAWWKARTVGDDRRCWEMADDLSKRHLKPGMPQSDIFAIIGRPDLQYDGNNTCSYHLGHINLMDSEWLQLTFDSRKRLQSAILEDF